LEYKIVISRRDAPDSPVAEIQNEANLVRWEYNRIGGCGSFGFDIYKRLFSDRSIELDANVKIYLKENGTYVLRYQGKVQSKNYSVRRNEEVINVQGYGYQVELRNIYVDRDYASTETSLVVANILNLDVVPNTNILLVTSTGIDVTTYTPDNLEFNTNSQNALQTLAEIVGSREWGVDENRYFYFKTRSSSVGFNLPIGSRIESLSYDVSSKEVVNRVVVFGGDVAGTTFTRTIDDTQSQLKWNRRDEVIQNTAIVSNDVADQFGEAKLAEFKNVSRRVRFSYIGDVIWEDSIPIPLVQIKTDVDKYGSRKYGYGLYNANVNLRINRISYSINEEGVMRSDLESGQIRPDISENISQLENKIEHLQSLGV
jgi:hypothetical protein